MISVKYASIIAGSFVASPELRAYAAATIGSDDIIDESIQSIDIKNGEVKDADIGADAVGASELVGVSKLHFCQYGIRDQATVKVAPSKLLKITCYVDGATDNDDSAVATLSRATHCFVVQRADIGFSGWVAVYLRNDCSFEAAVGEGSSISVIVFDK